MDIDRLWERIEPETRQWLVDNPGCRILPRTVAAEIVKATGADIEQDRHGESLLAPSDCEFIRVKAGLHHSQRR
jgi:hypothetical protein